MNNKSVALCRAIKLSSFNDLGHEMISIIQYIIVLLLKFFLF